MISSFAKANFVRITRICSNPNFAKTFQAINYNNHLHIMSMKSPKSFLLLFFIFSIISFVSCSKGLPEDVKKNPMNIVNNMGPIDISISNQTFYGWYNVMLPGSSNLFKSSLAVDLEKLLMEKGYFEIYKSRTGDSYHPTQKAIISKYWQQTGEDFPWKYYKLGVARRKFIKNTFENNWKDARGQKMGSILFNYELVPLLQDFPTLGPYEGKVILRLDRSEGKWKTVESIFPDQGIEEYVKYIATAKAKHTNSVNDIEKAKNLSFN